MANETSKSKELRSRLGHFEKYLLGRGLDIGAGDDPLVTPYGTVDIYDWGQGDAQYLQNIADDSYDFVYSSHCLEHMRSIEESLKNWCRVIKPGGTLYVTVPDWTLYEHEQWPSRFNADHKFTFSTTKRCADVGRDNHYHLTDIAHILNSFKVKVSEDSKLEDEGFDATLSADIDQTNNMPALCQILIVGHKRIL